MNDPKTNPPSGSTLLRALATAFLKHSALGEEDKIELRLMVAYESLTDTLHGGLLPYIEPTKPGEEDRARQLLPLRQEVLEYITLMEAGLKTFLDAHPMPAEE